ncbi:MAG: hypothetical protein PVJ56_20140 [Desulfobacterales bacterium]
MQVNGLETKKHKREAKAQKEQNSHAGLHKGIEQESFHSSSLSSRANATVNPRAANLYLMCFYQ